MNRRVRRYTMIGTCNHDCTSVVMAVVASKKNAALNTMLRSNAVNGSDFCRVHGLNRTSKNTIMKYFNALVSMLKYLGATVAMPNSAIAYNPYQVYSTP